MPARVDGSCEAIGTRVEVVEDNGSSVTLLDVLLIEFTSPHQPELTKLCASECSDCQCVGGALYLIVGLADLADEMWCEDSSVVSPRGPT